MSRRLLLCQLPRRNPRTFAARIGRLAVVLSLILAICTGRPGVTEAADRTGKPVPIPPVASIAQSDFGMAATGSPEATEAAVEVLQQGGNAIDAAVAAPDSAA